MAADANRSGRVHHAPRKPTATWNTSGTSDSSHGSGRCSIANPVYAEVIPRELTWVVQEELEQEAAWYVDAAGGLDAALPKADASLPTFLESLSDDGRTTGF